jgi:hypothetical protein
MSAMRQCAPAKVALATAVTELVSAAEAAGVGACTCTCCCIGSDWTPRKEKLMAGVGAAVAGATSEADMMRCKEVMTVEFGDW